MIEATNAEDRYTIFNVMTDGLRYDMRTLHRDGEGLRHLVTADLQCHAAVDRPSQSPNDLQLIQIGSRFSIDCEDEVIVLQACAFRRRILHHRKDSHSCLFSIDAYADTSESSAGSSILLCDVLPRVA